MSEFWNGSGPQFRECSRQFSRKHLRDPPENRRRVLRRISQTAFSADAFFSTDSLSFRSLEPSLSLSLDLVQTQLTANTGLEGVRFHDLRHTAASLLLSAGVHPKVVQERLGHSTVALTLDVYSHVLGSLQRNAADRIDEVLG